MSHERPFQTLTDRQAGRQLDRSLHDGVPHWLEPALRDWLQLALSSDVARRVTLNLRLAVSRFDFKDVLTNVSREHLLDIVDATLQLHSGWESPNSFVDGMFVTFRDVLRELEQILQDGRSIYRVDPDGRRLVRQVDETVQSAVEATIKEAPDRAGDHLRTAWLAGYGLKAEPDMAYHEAIKAVEEVACPLVEPKKTAAGRATLGTAIGELKNAGHKWELVLPDKDGNPQDVASLVSMMETLWDGQRSRHGGGPNSRRQTPEEAEAALHLAVLLVQWLTAGVLRRKA